MSSSKQNAYTAIIEHIFRSKYAPGQTEVHFERKELDEAADRLKIPRVKNLGDILYTFRYRAGMPRSVQKRALEGFSWIIRPTGRGKYAFAMVRNFDIAPNPNFSAIKIPDSTPGIIAKYALSDEQALLARVRYNRLIDIFCGVTCYPLQSHLRTTVADMGQVETDEIYVGVDRGGVHYVFPVQAKGGTDKLGVVQIEQDFAICEKRFPLLVCRPVAAQFMSGGTIALFEFTCTDDVVGIANEKHYRLLPPDQVTADDLAVYRNMSPR